MKESAGILHETKAMASRGSILGRQSAPSRASVFSSKSKAAELVRDAKVHEAELGNGTKSVVKMVIRIKNVKNLKHVKNAKIEDELMIHSCIQHRDRLLQARLPPPCRPANRGERSQAMAKTGSKIRSKCGNLPFDGTVKCGKLETGSR